MKLARRGDYFDFKLLKTREVVLYARKRLGSFLTCQWCEGEVLRLAALPLAVDDVEIHFDRMIDGRVSVGRHLNKQHILQDGV